jgi:hypothetical protein
LCTGAQAQGPSKDEDPSVARARIGIQKLRALVESGALPRAQLEQAEDALADAQDNAVLRCTMYSTDLTDEQAGEMVAAAGRRLERREKQLDKVRHLVDSGVAARNELETFVEEVDFAHKEYDLAVARANIAAEQVAVPVIPREITAVPPRAELHPGGVFTPADFERVEAAYEHHFGKALPVSAMGETAVHRALGFDHRGRVDVALHPDQPEGIWLRAYLAERHIPFIAFRQAVPGRATGAHIHMGPMSTRLAPSAAAD